MIENQSQVTYRGRPVDGHRLAEFVYGAVTGMVVLASMSGALATSWLDTALSVILGAVAIWLAHAYAILLSKRVTMGRRLTGNEIKHVFGGSWPIVSAGFLLAVPIVASAFGLWSLEASIQIASGLGVAILALVGFLAASITRETWSRRVVIAASYAGMGILVVAIENIIHH